MALRGVRVLELAGLAPAPFCGMILSDFGASVIRVDRPNNFLNADTLCRGKRSVILDLRKPAGVEVFQKLCGKADVLIDPFRAGVMEKLCLGPSDLCGLNPRLIYARLTGFGQSGPFAKMAGHDINYIAISGVLSALHHGDKPYHPVNLLGDFAGGGLICALGICMALLERVHSGKGQVIDANMVQGSSYVSSFLWTSRNPNYGLPLWGNSPGKNLLDGGAHFYQTYKTKDGKFMAVGALEPQFYKELLDGLGVNSDDFPQMADWEKSQERFQEIFSSKTQAEWCQIFDFKDACVTPVVPFEKTQEHCHNAANESFISDGNKIFPCPAPSLSRSPAKPSLQEPLPGEHTLEVLQELQLPQKQIDMLLSEGVVEIANNANTKSKL